MATAIAGFRTRIPAVDADNLLALLFGNPFQDLQELSERQIADLAPPQSLHPFQVKRLKAICFIHAMATSHAMLATEDRQDSN